MGITPEWLSAWGTVASPVLALLGGWLGWHLRGRQATRDALPIVRCEWHFGPAGFTCKIEMQNRINEDLHAIEARASADFAWYTYKHDAGGSITSNQLHTAPSPFPLDWIVKPLSTGNFSLSVSGADTPRWIKLKLCSSNRTLRSKWITLESK